MHDTRTGGDKPALVLLHGLAANGECWSEPAHILENEYDIIMPDAAATENQASLTTDIVTKTMQTM